MFTHTLTLTLQVVLEHLSRQSVSSPGLGICWLIHFGFPTYSIDINQNQCNEANPSTVLVILCYWAFREKLTSTTC